MSRGKTVLIIIAAVLAIDLITKEWARRFLIDSGPFVFLGGLINFEYAENPGAFLSVGSEMNDTLRFLIFTVGVCFVLMWAAWLIWKKQNLMRVELWGLSLLLSGGIGNLIDRVMKGSVTDFVQLGTGFLRTGIFNVADMAILGGVCLLFLTSFFEKRALKAKHRAAD